MLSIEYLKKQCPGYAPEILPPCCDELEDVSDFDAFFDVFEEQLCSLSRKYPDAEILVNLSSGTPQMKTTLALLSSTLQFPIRAIQVKNFENRSGTTERTNAKTCDLEYELEFNEDAEPGAPNRCSEPKLTLVQRDKQRAQIASLLRRRFRQPQPFRPGIPGGTSLRRGVAAGFGLRPLAPCRRTAPGQASSRESGLYRLHCRQPFGRRRPPGN